MDLKDQRVGNLGTAVELEPILLQQLIERRREIGQPPPHGEVAPPTEAFMIKDSYAYHREFRVDGSQVKGAPRKVLDKITLKGLRWEGQNKTQGEWEALYGGGR